MPQVPSSRKAANMSFNAAVQMQPCVPSSRTSDVRERDAPSERSSTCIESARHATMLPEGRRLEYGTSQQVHVVYESINSNGLRRFQRVEKLTLTRLVASRADVYVQVVFE